jgi:predicted nucleotidyltransferase
MADKNKDLLGGTEILFADGKKRTIRPLTIRNLRKFMKVVKDLRTDENLEDSDIDVMVEAAAIALSNVDPQLADDKDALEDALDLRCFGELMGAAMGSDPS